MARATFVEKAAKDYPEHGIKKGEPYYWWKFRYGSKQFSKTPPKASQLTQSEFYGAIGTLEERIGALEADDTLESECQDIAGELREIAQECIDKRDNMPESLQDSETGQLLQERSDAMEAAADEFEGVEFGEPDADFDEPEREEGESPEDYAKRIEEDREEFVAQFWSDKLEEVQNITIEAP